MEQQIITHKKHRMKMTSLLAFEEVIPTLQDREMQILKIIRKIQPCNNRMIEEASNLEINQITPRTKALRELKVLTWVKKEKCPINNKLTDFYQINDWVNQILII